MSDSGCQCLNRAYNEIQRNCKTGYIFRPRRNFQHEDGKNIRMVVALWETIVSDERNN